jgi:hypothetical protein
MTLCSKTSRLRIHPFTHTDTGMGLISYPRQSMGMCMNIGLPVKDGYKYL